MRGDFFLLEVFQRFAFVHSERNAALGSIANIVRLDGYYHSDCYVEMVYERPV